MTKLEELGPIVHGGLKTFGCEVTELKQNPVKGSKNVRIDGRLKSKKGQLKHFSTVVEKDYDVNATAETLIAQASKLA